MEQKSKHEISRISMEMVPVQLIITFQENSTKIASNYSRN